MFRLLFLFSLTILTNSKTIFPWNFTTISNKSFILSIQTATTPIETSTAWDPPTTTTIEYEEETTTATLNNKSYEFQSNFSRNNDSVFLSIHSNATNMLVSINNTFISKTQDADPCEILLREYSIRSNDTKTTIWIHFNGTFTHDLAIQLGDRFIDMADLLLTTRSIENQNNTETV